MFAGVGGNLAALMSPEATMRGLDDYLTRPYEVEEPCPECGERNPEDCECHDCTGCGMHEDECVCGLED
jgi:hypothetical protein